MRLWTVESGFESLPRNPPLCRRTNVLHGAATAPRIDPAWPHRLEAKDAALSRQKPEFESRWGHPKNEAFMHPFPFSPMVTEAWPFRRAHRARGPN